MNLPYIKHLDELIKYADSCTLPDIERRQSRERAQKEYEKILKELEHFQEHVHNSRNVMEIKGLSGDALKAWFVTTYANAYIQLLNRLIDAKARLDPRTKEDLILEKIQYLETLI